MLKTFFFIIFTGPLDLGNYPYCVLDGAPSINDHQIVSALIDLLNSNQ
jgi:hypothetical protein